MGIFKPYQWHSAKLRKKAKQYNMATLAVMALVLFSLYFSWSAYATIGMVLVGTVLIMMSHRVQNEDIKLRQSGYKSK